MALKTDLPDQITTTAQAEKLLSDLVKNSEAFNPEDDIFNIEWDQCEAPSNDELVLLKKLMDDIANIGFDACGFLFTALFPQLSTADQ